MCIRDRLTGDLDPVTEDMLIGQAGQLEMFQWFVRAHLEYKQGNLSNAGAKTEKEAAAKSSAKANGSTNGAKPKARAKR